MYIINYITCLLRGELWTQLKCVDLGEGVRRNTAWREHMLLTLRFNNTVTLTGPERVFVFQFFGGRPELALREHQQEVPEVHGQHEHCLIPHDHVVNHDDGQCHDGHDVHTAVPEQRPLFQRDGLPGGQACACWHAQRVVYGAAHHRAHSQVRFGQERPDHADEQFRCARGGRHKRRSCHVRRDAKICTDKIYAR